VLPPPKRGMHNVWQCPVLYHNYLKRRNKEYRIQDEREQCQRDLNARRRLRMSIELAAMEFNVSEERIHRGLRRMGLL
jgi:hypothetical protein